MEDDRERNGRQQFGAGGLGTNGARQQLTRGQPNKAVPKSGKKNIIARNVQNVRNLDAHTQKVLEHEARKNEPWTHERNEQYRLARGYGEPLSSAH